ncbi:hypothetical protein NT6N_13860 [Oceaniferula spumae]|uniref:Cytochrome c domain-containing protein n=1 Tax=Oceaniferula spumae TaxID=2979115 RepID=A0AAT9FK69_9BACT
MKQQPPFLPRKSSPSMLYRAWVFVGLLLMSVPVTAQPKEAYDLAPVNYSRAKDDNTITRLQAAMDEQRRTLPGSDSRQILKALLDELNIPVASQTLVFSKTSKQRDLISPTNPRVLYFNQDFYVGYVPGGIIEVIACDDLKGMMFYSFDTSLPQEKRRFERTTTCLSCHSNANTHDVPGLLVRSVYPEKDGQPLLDWGSFITTPASPMSERWGGWYVTGKHGDDKHMGNKWMTLSTDGKKQFREQDGQNVQDLSDYLNTDAYLTNTSDIVALMVMEHQIEVHNVLSSVRMNYLRRVYLSRAMHDGQFDPKDESSAKMIRTHVSEVLKALLFANETPLLGDGVQGSEAFTQVFSKRGKSYNDWSLRDLRLQKRMFKYRCSYMIHSASFKMLPEPVKSETLRQLHAILTKDLKLSGLPELSRREKERIHLILLNTHEGYQKAASEAP